MCETKTVYVITRGEYSDYTIETLFFNKKKAEKYVELHKGCRIEEMENEDERFQMQLNEYKEYYILEARYDIFSNEDGSEGEPVFKVKIDKQNTVTGGKAKSTYIEVPHKISINSKKVRSWGRKALVLQYELQEPVDVENDDIKEKYKKIITDKFTKVRSLMETEGWTWNMVSQWLMEENQ